MSINKTVLRRQRTIYNFFYSSPVVYKRPQCSAGSGALSNYFIHVRSCMSINETVLRRQWSTQSNFFYSCPVVHYFIHVRLCMIFNKTALFQLRTTFKLFYLQLAVYTHH